MNAEFVSVVRQRSARDLLVYSRMGWVLYPMGFLLCVASGLYQQNPAFFIGFVVFYALLLVWRVIQFRHFSTEPQSIRWFAIRVFLASSLWGVGAAYAAVHSHELAYAEALYIGSLALLGIGGLVMYVPVLWVFVTHLMGYAFSYSVASFFWLGFDAIPMVAGSLALEMGLLWVGRRQYLTHSRILVSSLLLERRAKELESAYAKLKEVNVHRVQFLESLSSEMHSSLDSINRVSEFLKQTSLGHEQLRMVETSRRTTCDLVQYLEGISEISAIESGKAEFFQDQIFLSRLLSGFFEEFAQQAVIAGRSFVYRLQPGLPEVVMADRHRLVQLVRIMCENCLRMTDSGGVIRVHIEWIADSKTDNTGHLLLRFSDTGVGLDHKYIRSLIDDAYLATNESESPMRGVSMHFALLGRILFRMRGTFKTDSLGDSGNAYEMEIPLEIVSWRTHPGESLEAHFDSLGLDEDDLPRILLIDENALNQRLVSRLCEVWGYTLEFASTSQQAMQWMELRHFDLVLVDLLMPMFDSFGTIQSIRQQAQVQQRRVPIVGLSSDMHGEGQKAASAIGVSAFVGKPFSPDVLYQVIAEQLNTKKNRYE